MKSVLKFIGAAIYGPLLAAAIGIMYYYLFVFSTTLSWFWFAVLCFCFTGLLIRLTTQITIWLSVPLCFLCFDNKASKVIPILSLLFFIVYTIIRIWEAPVDHDAQRFIGCLLFSFEAFGIYFALIMSIIEINRDALK